MAADQFILDLTTVLGASAVGGYLAHRLKQPALLGYILSGVLVGPYGFKLLENVEAIRGLAEIGVAFLLFALGVEFSLAQLNRVRDIAVRGSLLQIGLTIALATGSTFLLGWAANLTQGIFLGAVLSLSSTAVVLKTLTERGEINTLHGQVMLAILIAQDLALGLMLALLPALTEPVNLGSEIGLALLKVLLFLGGAVVLGRWGVPPLIRTVAATESGEIFLLTVIALCLGVALVTASLGLSIEMGAFVAGLMVAEIDHADHALAKVLPLRDTFASLFFASIGMLIDPDILLQNLGLILGLVTLVMVGKALILVPIVLSFGYSLKTALLTGLGINQIGEFSFVLSLFSLELGLISESIYLLPLGTTAITLVLTPICLSSAPTLADRLLEIPWLRRSLQRFEAPKDLFLPADLAGHVVVAGYGRVGQVIVNILLRQGYPVLVLENSEAAVQRLRQRQIPYVLGDADSELILEKINLHQAKALAIALPDPNSTRLLLKRSLRVAPQLDVIARSHQDQEIDLLTQLGSKEVVQPEFEAALALGAHLLKTLGKPEDHIQTAIQSIRADRYTSIRPQPL
ncbi:MAG: cation:proton antiporter [Prochlorothrix sp.]|nr:cation:proton antiporter [Prochlorothrix sp.]